MSNDAGSPYTRPVQIGSATLGGGHPFVLIAGPVLGDGHADDGAPFLLAERLSAQARQLDVALIFRMAAPRQGERRRVPFEETVSVLRDIRSRLSVPVAVDVSNAQQIALAAEVADLLQIPAAVCRQTDVVMEAARTGKPINIEKDATLAHAEALNLLDQVASEGNWNVMMTECGWVDRDWIAVDVRSIPLLREAGFPLVFDAGPRADVSNADGGSAQDTAGQAALTALSAGVDGIVLRAAGETLALLPRLLHQLKAVSANRGPGPMATSDQG